MDGLIWHVDLDAFFASVEQILDPALLGKPVIVAGRTSERGVVASASYEARRYGVRSGMPSVRARQLCPQAVFLPGNFSQYLDYSQKVFEIARQFSPVVQQTSVDEAYMDMRGTELLHGEMLDTAVQLKRRVKDRTGLNISIGLAGNPLIAKVASDYAKPNGLLLIKDGCEADFLADLPVRDLPGVGPQTAKTLGLYKVHTVRQLRRLGEKQLARLFGIYGQDLYERAWGRDECDFSEADPPKSISRETTFQQDTASKTFLRAMLGYLLERAAWSMRIEQSKARVVSIKLRYGDFQTVSKARSLGFYSDHDDDFLPVALELLDRLYRRPVRVRLVGVCLSGLAECSYRQGILWDERVYYRRCNMYKTIDHLRRRYGFGAVTYGKSLDLLGSCQKRENGLDLQTPCLSR